MMLKNLRTPSASLHMISPVIHHGATVWDDETGSPSHLRSIPISHHPIVFLAPFFQGIVDCLMSVMLFLMEHVANNLRHISIAE